jgi:hypothetical protein
MKNAPQSKKNTLESFFYVTPDVSERCYTDEGLTWQRAPREFAPPLFKD